MLPEVDEERLSGYSWRRERIPTLSVDMALQLLESLRIPKFERS
jgi:hypothetical protein